MFGTSERILTTHAGSLPRPPDLLQMMYDRGAGKPVDGAALEARIRSAVEEIVARQREIGLDLISDGEMSKSGFSTYIYERLSGFAGQGQFYANDMADFPDLAMRLFATPASALIVMPDCEGAIEPRNEQAVQRDIANFKAALGSDLTDLQEHIEQAIGVLNEATLRIPPEQMRLHVCWG